MSVPVTSKAGTTNQGGAQLTTSSLGVGTHSLTAKYSGESNLGILGIPNTSSSTSSAGSLTARQVIAAWPEIGPTVLVQDVACGWRELGTTPWEWVEEEAAA